MVVPHGQDFSSSNISDNTPDEPIIEPAAELEAEPEIEPAAEPIDEPVTEQPQAITSTDADVAVTDIAEPTMLENDMPEAINSGAIMSAAPEGPAPQTRSRFNFGPRRFDDKKISGSIVQPGAPAFANMLDYSGVRTGRTETKKRFIIPIAIAVLAAVLIGIILLVFRKDIANIGKISKDDTKAQITAFKKSCEKLTHGYGALMEEKPAQALARKITKNDFFLVDGDWINANKKNIQNYKKALNEIKQKESTLAISNEQKEELHNAIVDSEDLSGKINDNVEILGDFYDVFGGPAEKIAKGQKTISDCNNPEGIEKLAKYTKARDAITYFKSALCDAAAFGRTGYGLDYMTNFNNFTVAKRMLTYTLTDVSGHAFDLNTVRHILTQLELHDEK